MRLDLGSRSREMLWRVIPRQLPPRCPSRGEGVYIGPSTAPRTALLFPRLVRTYPSTLHL